MGQGLFRPLHLILLLIFLAGVFVVFRVLWRLTSKHK
jgi:hypothetical protein